jgi:WD40 repeat protein
VKGALDIEVEEGYLRGSWGGVRVEASFGNQYDHQRGTYDDYTWLRAFFDPPLLLGSLQRSRGVRRGLKRGAGRGILAGRAASCAGRRHPGRGRGGLREPGERGILAGDRNILPGERLRRAALLTRRRGRRCLSPMNYGTDRFLLADGDPTLTRVGDTLVAVCERQIDGARLQTVDLASGEVVTGDRTVAHAVLGERVLAAPKAAPGTLRAYAIPSLTAGAEIAVGGEIVAVAVADGAVAALLAGGTLALVEAALAGAPRPVAVEGARLAAFSPDGSTLAVGAESGRVTLIDVAKGTVLRQLLGGRAPIKSLAWSADGGTVAASSAKSALVWPAAGGKAVTVFKAKSFAVVVGFHGRRLVVHDLHKTISAVDVDTLATAWQHPHYGPVVLRGDRVISARFDVIREIDAQSGAILRTLTSVNGSPYGVEVAGDTVFMGELIGHRVHLGDLATGTWRAAPPGHEAELLCVAFDGDRFATGGRDTRSLVWKRGQAQPIAADHAGSTGYVAAIALEGDTVWSAAGYGLRRFRASDGALEAEIVTGHAVRLLALAGGLLFVCTEVGRGHHGELSLRDPVTLEPVHSERLARNYARAYVSGTMVRLHGERTWFEYDVAAREFGAHGGAAGESRNAEGLLSRDETIVVERRTTDDVSTWWSRDVATGAALFEARTAPRFWGAPDLDDAGQRLATGHRDGKVRIWDARGGALLREIDATILVYGVRWTPDGAAVLAWDERGALVELAV